MSYNTLERLGNLLRSLKGIWWFPFLFNIHNKYIRFRPTNSSVAILRVLFSMDLHITGIQLRDHCPRCLGTFPWWEEGYFIFIYHSYSLHLSESEKCIVYTLRHWKLLGLQTKGDLIFFKTTFFFWFLLLVITPFTPLTSPLPFIPALLWIPRSHATSKEFNKIEFFTFLFVSSISFLLLLYQITTA